MKTAVIKLMAIALFFSLNACGKKGELEPPEKFQASAYYASYTD